MASPVIALSTSEMLHGFVLETLCGHDRLDPAQTPLYGATISRGGRDSGMFFYVEGPRMLKTSAIWSADEHRILFYDSTGLRFHEVKLSESPMLEVIPMAMAA
jgi:hypothetical protein